MSSLQRYKKSGGFFQLLSLIETFGPQKKEKFLEMIDAESKVWGQALRQKMLTLERIFQWPDQVLIEVFKSLPIKNMAVALEGIKAEQKARIEQFLSASEKRKILDALGESKLKPEEIAATMVKVVETARKMLSAKELHAEKFDANLMIPEDFEARLEEQNIAQQADSLVEASQTPDLSGLAAVASGQPAPAPAAGGGGAEVAHLQRTLAVAMKENKALKDEVKVLREKLEQIRRIA